MTWFASKPLEFINKFSDKQKNSKFTKGVIQQLSITQFELNINFTSCEVVIKYPSWIFFSGQQTIMSEKYKCLTNCRPNFLSPQKFTSFPRIRHWKHRYNIPSNTCLDIPPKNCFSTTCQSKWLTTSPNTLFELKHKFMR